MRRPTLEICNQINIKPVCIAAETSKNLNIASIGLLFRHQIKMALIRLRRCAYWSAPLFFPNNINQVFSKGSSYLTHGFRFLCACVCLPNKIYKNL